MKGKCKTVMRKKAVYAAAAVLSAILLLCCPGCDFSPTIITNADAPNVVLEQFFTRLKDKDYEECDRLLADHATFVMTDNSNYGIMDDLAELSLDSLEYELVGEPEINGTSASQRVLVRSMDMKNLIFLMKKNIVQIEYQYLVDNGKSSLDKENPDDVAAVMREAMNKYAGEAGIVENEITVKFKFSGDAWKIKVDTPLTAAIFGGAVNE